MLGPDDVFEIHIQIGTPIHFVIVLWVEEPFDLLGMPLSLMEVGNDLHFGVVVGLDGAAFDVMQYHASHPPELASKELSVLHASACCVDYVGEG